MAALNANAYYQANQVTTASRGQLLLMAYDGMLRFLKEAQHAMQEQRYEAQGTYIGKTQAILMELLRTLDPRPYPELANNLDRLYRYLYDRLVWANVHDDQDALCEVSRHLTELRATWAEADILSRRGDAVPGLAGH